MANETSAALSHLGILNRQFSDALSPLNNYSAINVQQGLERQKAELQQAMEMQRMAFANRMAQVNQLAQFEHSKALAKMTEDRTIEHAKLVHAFAREDQIKTQADAIRNNEKARRLVGDKIKAFKDSPEGNMSLVEAYTQASSDPKALEKLDLEDAVAASKAIKETLTRLTSNIAGSPQGKQAVQRFLAQPGVVDLLVKKGNMTAAEINKLMQSGDAGQINKVLDAVSKEATLLFGRDEKVLSQLAGAWTQAIVESGAAPTPDQMVNLDYLKMLMQRRDTAAQGLRSEDSFKALSEANGYSSPQQVKLPPPVNGPTNVNTPNAIGATNVNPFAAPTPIDNGKVGLGTMFQNGPQKDYNYGLSRAEGDPNEPTSSMGRLDAAFHPTPYAKDPNTEYAIRQELLNRERREQAITSGITSAIPFIPNYTLSYNAFKQIEDEKKIQQLVQGLYSPRK